MGQKPMDNNSELLSVRACPPSSRGPNKKILLGIGINYGVPGLSLRQCRGDGCGNGIYFFDDYSVSINPRVVWEEKILISWSKNS